MALQEQITTDYIYRINETIEHNYELTYKDGSTAEIVYVDGVWYERVSAAKVDMSQWGHCQSWERTKPEVPMISKEEWEKHTRSVEQ